jgi:5'-nucleotidase
MKRTAWSGVVVLSALVVLRSVFAADLVTISIVGTSDLHGEVFARNGRGGLALFGGYVNNLRAARQADGGTVLLIDAGDTFLGTVESHLTEGALVVDAYNALGYTAAAIGNHEFEFGQVDPIPPRLTEPGDPRGALKALAARARYPLLAANLIDESTGRPVEWANVRPSILVDVQGLKVGIVGVMTIDALYATLAANVHGLRVAPLAPAIAAESAKLRSNGADIVIVASHAGGRCAGFDTPYDLSSCDTASEIFEVVRALPPGAVDVIVAGHAHAGMAHIVQGVAIIESFNGGVAFGRVDLTLDRQTRQIVDRRLFPPRMFAEEARGNVPPVYEGQAVVADPRIEEAMRPELQRVQQLRTIPLGVVLDTPIGRAGELESPLGNLFADAIRESTPTADVGVNNNRRGGLRADLPEGPLTFGPIYDAFPFDNRLVTLSVSAATLSDIFANEIRAGRRGWLGISGVRVRATCVGGRLHVTMTRASGVPIEPSERLVVVTTDTMATGAIFGPPALSPAVPAEGLTIPSAAPIARERVTEWLRSKGGHLSAAQFADPQHPRWEYPPDPAECR